MNQHFTTRTAAQPHEPLRLAFRGRRLIATLCLAAIGLAAIGLAACGGGGGGDGAPPPAIGNVGPAGVTLTSSDSKATLTVPAGAVVTPINVTLVPATGGYTADALIVPGTVFALDAPDTNLALPADLTITVPASALETAQSQSAQRKHALAVVEPSGWLACEKGYTPGADVPAGTACQWKASVWFNCPPTFIKIAYVESYGVVFCEAGPPPPPPVIARLSLTQPAVYLPSIFNRSVLSSTAKLSALGKGIYAVLVDKVAPTVQLTSVVTPVGNGLATIRLTVAATDNVGVASVSLVKWQILPPNPASQVVTLVKTSLAQFVAPPYAWESPPMPLEQIYNHTYIARALDAAGNNGGTSNTVTQGAPVVTAFAASPAAVPFGGGSVTLSWSASNTNTLTIDNGVGDVTGLSSKTVSVTSPTTFTLTATNTGGTVTATTAVTVGALPAPTISSFTAAPNSLPVGGGAVTLNWATAGATSLTVDNVAVTGTSKVVNVTVNTTFTLTASNASGSPTAQASVVVATSSDRFVDLVAGLDTNTCAQAAPCLTVAKAMTGAPAGSTVYLADGSYSANTQPNVTIPDGVTLRATNAGAAVLAGFILTATGSATFSGVVVGPGPGFSCTIINAASTTGTPTLTLTGVQFRCEGGTTIGGKVKAVMTPGALVGGLYTAGLNDGTYPIIRLTGTAELLIQGGVIDGNNAGLGASAGLLSSTSSSRLTLDAVTVRNRQAAALVLLGTSTIVLRNGTLIDNVGTPGTFEGAVHIMGPGTFMMDHAQISNLPGVGILVDFLPTAPTLQLTLSTITHAVTAIRSAYGFAGTAATVTADGLSLTNNVNGIVWYGAVGANFDLRNSTFSGNTAIGISVDSPAGAAFKLRGSSVAGNATDGLSLAGAMTADLGSVADAGVNTFSGNGVTGLRTGVANAGLTVDAVGNTWAANEPAAGGVPATNALGKYPAGTAVTGPRAHGKNFRVDNGSTLKL